MDVAFAFVQGSQQVVVEVEGPAVIGKFFEAEVFADEGRQQEHNHVRRFLMAPKTSWLDLTSTQQAEIDAVARTNGWRIVGHGDLPTVLPVSFREKIDSAVVIASGTTSGVTYLVYDNLRVDVNDDAIDHDPFGIVVYSTGASPRGMLLHHGDWDGRTEQPPDSFWDYVRDSGIGDYFYTNPPSGQSTGTLENLPNGHRGAFEAVVERIRRG